MNQLVILLILILRLPVAESTILNEKVTMKVYPSEILESVVNRLNDNTGKHIYFDIQMLLPYNAKAADYRDVTVKFILEEQLKGTPLTYGIKNKNLFVIQK